eukprot:2397590-Alexandrium_andersonii.AAC.1
MVEAARAAHHEAEEAVAAVREEIARESYRAAGAGPVTAARGLAMQIEQLPCAVAASNGGAALEAIQQ